MVGFATFQSAPPVRGAMLNKHKRYAAQRFQSAPPVRGAIFDLAFELALAR